MSAKIYNFIIRIISCLIPFKNIRKSFRKKLTFYNVNNKIYVHKQNGKVVRVRKYKGLKIKFCSKNSTVHIYEPCAFYNSSIIAGCENLIEIKSSKYPISKLKVPAQMSKGSKLLIDENFSCCGVDIYLHDEPETSVKIGKDCQCSFGVIIWPSDGHAIYDIKSGEILNFGKNIIINDHVWLGMHTRILKGSTVPKNSVIGANSVYTSSSNKKEYKAESLGGGVYAGLPAKLIRDNINWVRANPYYYKLEKLEDENSKS